MTGKVQSIAGTASRDIAAIIAISAHLMAVNGGYSLVGWNNLGMHCMDSDYSVFSILPPTTPSMLNSSMPQAIS